METRPVYVVGDLLGNILVGAVAGIATAYVCSPEWAMWSAMLMGMLVGMLAGSALAFVALVPLLGAIEVLVPTMFSGMMAGMLVAMADSAGNLTVSAAAGWGALVGLAVIAVIMRLNARLAGFRPELIDRDGR